MIVYETAHYTLLRRRVLLHHQQYVRSWGGTAIYYLFFIESNNIQDVMDVTACQYVHHTQDAFLWRTRYLLLVHSNALWLNLSWDNNT